jgi:hypothetical protein
MASKRLSVTRRVDFLADAEQMQLCLGCLLIVIINPGCLHCGQ